MKNSLTLTSAQHHVLLNFRSSSQQSLTSTSSPLLSSPPHERISSCIAKKMASILLLGTAASLLIHRARVAHNTPAHHTPAAPKTKTDVVVVGASNIDLITYCDRCPGPGETIHGKTFAQGFGGKGANQAVMAAKLGADTEIVTCVGTDGFGDATVANFAANSLSCRGVLRATGSESTGVAPIWVDANGENRILIVNGANDCLLPQHLQEGSSLHSIVSNARVLICQLEIKAETTLAALRVGRASGVLTILNPAPATQKLDPLFYTYSDIVAPNQSEAQLLTGCDATTEEGAKAAGRALIAMGVKCVVMTLGPDGALIMINGNGGEHDSAMVQAPLIESVLDTSGAGDCFLGSFAYYLTCGGSGGGGKTRSMEDMLTMDTLVKAARYACCAATLSVQKKGTQSSYPDKESIVENWPRDFFS